MLSQSWAYDKVICIAVCKLLNRKERLTIQTFCFLQALPAENGNICKFATVYLQSWRWPEILLKDGQETINMMVDKLCSFLAQMHVTFLSLMFPHWCQAVKTPQSTWNITFTEKFERGIWQQSPQLEAGQKLDMCNLWNGSCWHASSIECLLAVVWSSVA
jgi:hypothetical protein